MKKSGPDLLVVDDDEGIRRQLRWAFDGLDVVEAGERAAALALMRKQAVPVVILDLGLPPDPDGPSEGMKTLEEILSFAPQTKVIVMSGQSEREYAIRAVGAGAYDFYQKPLDFDALSLMVQRAIRLHKLEAENRRLANSANASPLPGLISNDPKMLKVCEQIRLFAGADMTVLLVGESGTGKELLARAIHDLSRRSEQPYVAINCAAIPETLLESELFGHEKGTFTGAHKTVAGKVEMANKGTLLLDEIGDLPMPLQAKLLRFLQERVVERVGGRKAIPVDIRVISATNRDPRTLIEEGLFREDLYYRLSEAVIHIPPLRERPNDIIAISQHLLGRFTEEAGFSSRSFTPEALAAMTNHAWPGNVRELENRVKRAVVTSQSPAIAAAELDLSTTQRSQKTLTLREARENAERGAIQSAMAEAGGNISEAAKILETSRPTLYQLIKRYRIDK